MKNETLILAKIPKGTIDQVASNKDVHKKYQCVFFVANSKYKCGLMDADS
jgi:hypothetical protein